MGTELALTEPLQLPDKARPDRMPSLPEWVASRIASVTDEHQNDGSGKHRNMMTLPANLMLGSSERKQIEAHAGALHAALTRTPATSADAEAETLVLVTKLMLAKPGMRSSEAGAEATGEAYQAALEDLPPWAVAAAIRRWHRGDCHDMLDKERPNYDFRPSTAKLRAVAFAEASKVRGRVIELERVLAAVPRIEYSPEHRAEMRARLAAASPILRAIVQSPEAVIAENRMREAERLGRLADRRAAEAAE